MDGRHSTPLHFAAGYNRVPVVEYLLQHGADVHAKDKGLEYCWTKSFTSNLNTVHHFIFLVFFLSGLVPLHNACSYGHYEVTELLVKVWNIFLFQMPFSYLNVLLFTLLLLLAWSQCKCIRFMEIYSSAWGFCKGKIWNR